MSGGHFDYIQFRMEEVANEIDRLIDMNGTGEKNYWGEDIGHEYPPEVIARFKEAAHTIRQVQEMTQRIDWLVSGDDGAEAFITRWNEEVRSYFLQKNKGES